MSVDTLLVRMRKAREINVDALGHVFTVRLLTQGELQDLAEELAGKALTIRRVVEASTVGWNLTELDLVPGGDPVPAPFAPELFHEWLGEHLEAAEPIFVALSNEHEARRARLDTAEKN